MPDGVTLVEFAEKMALVARTKSEDILISQVNRELLRVSSAMERFKLTLTPRKN